MRIIASRVVEQDGKDDDDHADENDGVSEFAQDVYDGSPADGGDEGGDVIDQVQAAAADDERPAD